MLSPARGTAVSGDDKGASAAATIEPDTVEHPDIFVLRPNVWPQPSVSARGDDLTIVHMEQDPVSQIGTILLARYESEANAFADPMIVASNRNGITQPIVVDLSDSIHLVTWTQSRFSPESVGTDRKYGAMLRSLDVWYAVCNSRSGLVEGIGLLDDDLSGHVSGRMEGNPVVAPLSDTRGLITWIVADPSAGESDLFSATVARVDDRWVAQPPERAITISGIEHDLSIAGVDADHAVAAWINKADVESDEQRVFSSEWSDAGWGEPRSGCK